MNLVNVLAEVTCGNLGFKFDESLPKIVNIVVFAIKVFVPLLLIIFGMLDLGKAVIAQKDDEIKKGQQTLIKRVIAAAIVFFVVTIAQLLVNVVGGSDSSNISNCISCFTGGTTGITNRCR